VIDRVRANKWGAKNGRGAEMGDFSRGLRCGKVGEWEALGKLNEKANGMPGGESMTFFLGLPTYQITF